MIGGAVAPFFAPMLVLTSPLAGDGAPAAAAPVANTTPAATTDATHRPAMVVKVSPADSVPHPATQDAESSTGAINGAATTAIKAAADQSEEQEIVVQANPRGSAPDPLRAVNEKSFEATVAIDDAVARPIALAYAEAVPEPLRNGLRNALDNLAEPVTFINNVLQLKPVSAMRTVARFAINSVVGIGGLFDMAKRKPFNLVRRRNGFANTLGYYGVRPGAFFYVPLIGPTTLRDLIGGMIDRAFLPTVVGRPFNSVAYIAPVGVLSTLDRRVRNDGKIVSLREQEDPYLAARRSYLRQRQAEIDALHGR